MAVEDCLEHKRYIYSPSAMLYALVDDILLVRLKLLDALCRGDIVVVAVTKATLEAQGDKVVRYRKACYEVGGVVAVDLLVAHKE